MALPVLDKTWIYDLNNIVALDGTKSGSSGADDATTDRKTVLLGIKNAFKASAKWTVKSSCGGNGSNFDAGKVTNANDNWVTPEDLMWEDTSAPKDHAWIVLVNTDLDLELLLDLRNDANNDGGKLGCYISRPTATSSGGFSGGTLSVRPTATDEQVVMSETNGNGWGTGVNFSGGLAMVWNVWVSDDGECTRVIILANNIPIGFWMFDKVKNPVTDGDVLCAIEGNGGTTSTNTTISRYYDAPSFVTMSHIEGGAPTFRDITETEGFNVYLTQETFGSQPCSQQFNTANDIDGSYGLFPMGCASLDNRFKGRHGEVFDFWYGLDILVTGDTYPAAGSRLFCQFGDMVFSWDGSVPVLS